MKPSNLLSSLRGAFALLAASVAAQTIAPAPPANKDDPITLSAFTVTASNDVGYTATNTLAGTRLNTPLRDVGTAVSVITKELLNDLAAHDSGTLLPYTVGTEIGGVEGNFAGGAMQGPRADQNDARSEPERNQRVRGLASAELTRDFFLSDLPFDSYNTERVTINRGPNALLFGIGSPGGVINNATIAPHFGNDFYETQLQLGARGTHRESFDFNRQLIPRRLAVRVAALNENTEFRQRPAWERDQRVFGAVTAILAENRRSTILGPTTLRANAEYGDIHGNPPNVIPPNDGFSSWWSLPSRSLQQFTGTTFPPFYDDGTYVPRNTIDNRTILPQALPTLPMPFVIPYFLHIGLIYSQPGQPNFGFTNPQFSGLVGGQGRILYPASSGRVRMDIFSTRSAFATGEFPGFTIPSMRDRNVFDYYNKLYTGNSNRSGRDFKTGTVTLEQAFWDGRAGLEVSYDYQRYRTARAFPWGAGDDSGGGYAEVLIDVARYTSNDQPNPNLGRPFYRTIGMVDSDSRIDRETSRATAFITLDGKDLFGKGRAGFWFGRHTLTGMYFNHTINTRSREFGMGWDSNTVNLTSLLNMTINQYRRQVTPLVYVGPSLLNAASPDAMRLQPIDAVLPQNGDRYTLFYYEPSVQQVRTAEFIARRYLNNAGIGRREIESSVASLQSYFLGGYLVTIAGVRRDEQTVFERINLDNDTDPLTSDRLPPGDFDPAAIRLRSEPSDVSSGNTLTWSVVGRYPEKILGKLPLGGDLRLFFNKSENFNPVGARRNVFNERLAPPTGTTREYGAMIDLFGGKISARINRFETSGENFTNAALQTTTNAATIFTGNFGLTRMLEAQRSNYTLERAGLAQAGYTSYAQAYQDIINLLPEPTRSAKNFRIETINGIPVVQSNPILGAATTTSFVAKGWELDLTANPVNGLRVMFNVARQETVKSNIAPDLKKLAAQTLANIDASRLRDVPDSPVISETTTFRQRYISNVMTPLTGELAKEGTISLEQREWRVNSVVSYDFRRGRLKGWGLGGGVRWQSSVATGYPTFAGPSGIPVPDLKKPFLSGSETNGDLWLSYKRRLFKDRVDWKIQLHLRNAIGSNDPIPVVTNPDGSLAIVRTPPSKEWFVTSTLRF